MLYQTILKLGDTFLAMLGAILEHLVFSQHEPKVCIKCVEVDQLL